jgi:hypothetical protein
VDTLVGTAKCNNMLVNVVRQEGLIGYRFDAVGKESLPLAVDLAHKQAIAMREDDSFIKNWQLKRGN